MIRRTSSCCSGKRNPSKRTSPLSAISKVERMRIKLDLPEPFGPRTPYVSPSATLNETPSTAQISDVFRKPVRLRKLLRRLRTCIAGCCMITSQVIAHEKTTTTKNETFELLLEKEEALSPPSPEYTSSGMT